MDFVFAGGIAIVTLQLINLITFLTIQKSKSDQKKIAKRNIYVRKFLLGKPDEESQDQ
ncbi:hypothetical protein H2200_005745 [Cladophialophora chaetospira]|uniref:Uncharacterized protein n=1 Tax=Cladophialophora chaetospira TaxID=386627 RepID=A0AA39CHW4_9EURO|nr:hypothetical protein H2200_005745 [Cladophialophora chaetospira]